jgi:uncharacterized protein (TIGR02001 family)
MIMKKTLPILLGVLGLASVSTSPALAVDGLSANAAVTTNYVFRGISQSGAQSAVQAGLDYDLGTAGIPGLAIGVWASSIDFGHTFGEDTPMELDLYGSYTGNITPELTYSFGGIHYTYPNAPAGINYNWYEIWAGLGYDFGIFALSGKVYYSPDYVNLSDREIYYSGGVSVPIVRQMNGMGVGLALNANVGYTDLESDVPPIIKSYTDWNVSIAASYQAYTLTLGYTDTDLDGIYEITSGPFETDGQFYVMFGFKFM